MFATLANKQKLRAATSPSDDVTPIYLLEELWSILQSSGPETCDGFSKFVLERLEHKSPVVKQKTLRVIKFLSDKGPSGFKRSISKSSQPIRQLTHYKGDPDPFKGDAPNQRVRDAAKEAVSAIFAPTETPSYQASQSSLQSRIKGFGNTNASEGVSSSKANSGLMGFGSSSKYSAFSSGASKPPPRASKSFGSRGNLDEGPDSSLREKEGFGSMVKRVGSGVLSPKGIVNLVNAKSSELGFRRSNSHSHSILSDTDDEHEDDDGEENDHREYTAESPIQLASLATDQKASTKKKVSSSGEEARLVNQLCTPGGVRAQPSPEELRVFVESTASLSGKSVAEQLESKVGDSSWQAALRALCAIEAVIKQGSTTACGQIAVYFQADPSSIMEAQEAPQASLRQRATRVLELLGVTDRRSSASAANQSAPAGAKAAAVPDLLGGLDDVSTPQAATQSQPRQADGSDLIGDLMNGSGTSQATQSAVDLFSGINLGGSPAPIDSTNVSKPAQSSDLFGGLETLNTAANPAANADLFGGLSTVSGGSRTASTAQQPASSDLSDLFSATTISSTQGRNVPGGGDLLQGLSVGGGGAAQSMPNIFSDFGGQPQATPSLFQNQPSAAGMGGANLMQQHSTAARAASMERNSDPLSSLGLPTPTQAPMGLGMSGGMNHQRQGSSGMPLGAALPATALPQNLGQLTPQQLSQLNPQQRQYIWQMQQMRQGGGQPGFQQQPQFPASQGGMLPHSMTKQPSIGGLDSGFGSSGRQGSLGGQGPPVSSSQIGISRQTDFDFVNDHVKDLRGKR